MTKIYAIRLSDITDKENILIKIVGNRRREKTKRFIRAEDRLRSLAVGYLMAIYLPGFSEDRLSIGKDGKPFLEGGIAFNVSHGGNFIVLAWDDSTEGIGIDVEPITKMDYLKDILPMYATTREQESIGEDVKKALWVWTRKESLYKCIGEGITDPLELPEVLEDKVRFFGKICHLKTIEKEGHIFSVALNGGDSNRASSALDISFNVINFPVSLSKP